MTDQQEATGQEQQRQIGIQRIYLKDLSFETPNSPAIFRTDGQPDNQLNLNTGISKLEDDVFEVVLTLTLTTKVGEKAAYIVEVQQAGIFLLKGFADQELSHLLGAYCPNTLFPYARETISDLVTKGSFPQMILQPINFDALFLQQQQARAQQQKGDTPAPN